MIQAPADEAISATQRWLERAVIGLNLCPFAKAVHVKAQIRYVVTHAVDATQLEAVLVDELTLLHRADPAAIDTTLLIHPRALLDFGDYNAFLDHADAAVARLGLRGELQVASFHPDYVFAGEPADDPSNATNRSPYPMLHLLREASIDRAVAAFPDPDVIVARNIATLRQLGLDGYRALLADGENATL